jgi:hypothetical protein
MSFAPAVAYTAPRFPTFNRGVSETAKSLQDDLANMFVRPDVHELRHRLILALSRSREPVAVGTVSRALALLAMIPAELCDADVVLEETGEIALDWQDARNLVLSVVVKNSGSLGYAALLRDEPIYGRAPFSGTLPQTVAHLMARFSAARASADRPA